MAAFAKHCEGRLIEGIVDDGGIGHDPQLVDFFKLGYAARNVGNEQGHPHRKNERDESKEESVTEPTGTGEPGNSMK